MNIFDPATAPSDPGSPDYFVGAVAPNKILRVELGPGARTEWLEPVSDEQYRAT